MNLKISKINDIVENLDVQGQGCYDDCYTVVYLGNKEWGSGCEDHSGWSAMITTWW